MTVHNPLDARSASGAGTPTSRPPSTTVATVATSGAAASPATSPTSPGPADPASGAPGAAGDPLLESPATLDVFALGRRAAAARDARWGATASFVRAREWVARGAAPEGGTTWRGPRDAAESFAELLATPEWTDEDRARAVAAGVGLWLGRPGSALHRALVDAGGRVLYRFPFRAGEPAAERRARLLTLQATVSSGLPLWGVMPTPVGEPEGIDTLRVVAALRLELPALPHLVLDVAALGPRLAQMALGFGGDELWAPIVSERALRLGGNANNPAMTRKEAGVLIQGAGLRPRERLTADRYAEEAA
jgi:hypothetical protein